MEFTLVLFGLERAGILKSFPSRGQSRRGIESRALVGVGPETLPSPPASVTAPETPVSFSGSHREEPPGGLEGGGADVGRTGVTTACTCLMAWTSLVLGCHGFLKDAFWEAPGVGRAGGLCKEGSPLPTDTFHGPGFPLLFFLPKPRSVETMCCSLPPPPRKHIVSPPGKIVHC